NGGLRIRSLKEWNETLLVKQLWKVIEDKESLWVKWVNVVKLKQKSLWEISLNTNDSWGWKNMLDLRDKIKEFVLYKVGNGEKISIWHDKWCEQGPLINIVSYRSIYDARFKPNATVAELIEDGHWIWPNEWYDKYPVLKDIQCPSINVSMKDNVLWRNRSGVPIPYSTKAVWKDLRGVWPIKKWHNVVWFSQLNPKHAFVLWIAIQRRLLTQDRIMVWNKDEDLKCSMCKLVADSHKHLFFECVFSAKVWKDMSQLMKLDKHYDSMDEVVQFLESQAPKNKIWRVMNRLILAAVIYYLWHERNGRIFRQESRNESEVCCIIKENIKNKLMSLKVKRSSAVMKVADVWGLKWAKNPQIPIGDGDGDVKRILDEDGGGDEDEAEK
ncbi:RNA-directed DNA polymerase, eukaryota, reverse transcriptase zinc-binding domain protein, partial [Tanacetum coccineum]